MAYHFGDTICAVASAPGGAARGVVRLSGDQAITIGARLFRSDDGKPLEAQRSSGTIRGRIQFEAGIGKSSPALSILPALVCVWPTERSYTREPVAEFHTIGAPPLLDALLQTLCQCGARLARPGEFTLRAFLAGRLDLTQAEAVLGVINADSEPELKRSLSQLAGNLARPLAELREELLQLLAELEAGLDFVEENIEFISNSAAIERVEHSLEALRQIATQTEGRRTASAATRVVLVGPPNVGKSSLFNALIERWGEHQATRGASQAIVSSRHGTTRDFLVGTLNLDGYSLELIDTAGIEETASSDVDARAKQASVLCRDDATIRIWCTDSSSSHVTTSLLQRQDIVVRTKGDLLGSAERAIVPPEMIVVSSRKGAGLDQLRRALQHSLNTEQAARSSQATAMTAARAGESVFYAQEALQNALELLRSNEGNELVVAELRAALDELGKVVGVVYTDDILDRVFSTFCIGK